MSQIHEKLKAKLQELFQLDRPELDFGRNGRVAAACSIACMVGVGGCNVDSEHGARSSFATGEGSVVYHDLRVSDTLPSCEVGASPRLTIGGGSAAPQALLYDVTDAIRLDDGRVVVVNRGTQEVRFYDEWGGLLRKLGAGQGPGEFVDPTAVALLAPDSVVVWDWGSYRISVLTHDGAFARSISLLGSSMSASPVGELAVLVDDPPFVVTADDGVRMTSKVGELVDRSFFLVRYGREGGLVDTVARVPDGKQGLIAARTGARPLLGARGSFVAHGDFVAWSGGGSPEVTIARPGAGSQLRLTWRTTDRSVVPADVDWEYDRLTRKWRDHERLLEAVRATRDVLPIPDSLPAVTALKVDREGHIWVRRFAEREWQEDEWWSFTNTGAFRCRMGLPLGTDVLDIGNGYVVGKTRDELGVETLAVLIVEKPATQHSP